MLCCFGLVAVFAMALLWAVFFVFITVIGLGVVMVNAPKFLMERGKEMIQLRKTIERKNK